MSQFKGGAKRTYENSMWNQEGAKKSNAKQFDEHGKLVEAYNIGRSTRDANQVTVSSTYKPSLRAPWNEGRELTASAHSGWRELPASANPGSSWQDRDNHAASSWELPAPESFLQAIWEL